MLANKGPQMTTDNAQDPQTRLVDVDALALALEKFATDRDWAQFHSPKNLVMALTGEVGELSELFQWMPQEQSHHVAKDPQLAEPLRDELADVLLYLVRLASVLGVDLNEAAISKLKKNADKYPVAAAYGSSRKYTEI